jgi:hypothetical protein
VYLVTGPVDTDVSAAAVATTVYQGDGATGTVDLRFDGRRGGDYDGDGTDDVLVGVDVDGGGAEDGGVFLYTERRPGVWPFESASMRLTRGSPRDPVSSVAWLGDVDGDGGDDLVIGAGTADGGGPNTGVAWIVAGGGLGSRRLADTPWQVWGAEDGGLVGRSVAGPGDLDGGGVPDLLIGAPGVAVNGERGAGAVYFFRGEELR